MAFVSDHLFDLLSKEAKCCQSEYAIAYYIVLEVKSVRRTAVVTVVVLHLHRVN